METKPQGPIPKLSEWMISTSVGDWKIRCWFAAEKIPYGTAIRELEITLSELVRLMVRPSMDQLVDHLKTLDSIAAFEVTNRGGSGVVVYMEWP